MSNNNLSNTNPVKKFIASNGRVRFMGTAVSIVMGLILGLILLLCFNASFAFTGMSKILTTAFADDTGFTKLLYETSS